MTSHLAQVSRALDLMVDGVAPFVEERLRATHGDRWLDAARKSFSGPRDRFAETGDGVDWDAHTLLTVMWDQWNAAFRNHLGHSERSLVSELREVRNRWAHQEEFDFDDVYRCLDSVHRLLRAVNAGQAEELAIEKRELMRSEFVRQEDLSVRSRQVKQQRWRSLLVYVACATLLVIVVLTRFGLDGWPVAAMIVITFGYFSWRLFTDNVVLLGPHECRRCHRIIYSEPCPYCNPHGTS